MENKLYSGLTIFPKPYSCCEANEGGNNLNGPVSWNDLTDKPFYDKTPTPITFDGNLEGKEAVYAGETAMAGTSMWFVRMADFIPIEQILGAAATLHSVDYPNDDQVYDFEEDLIVPASDFGVEDALSYGASISGLPGAICMHADGKILISNGIVTIDCYLTTGLWIMCAVENNISIMYVTNVTFPEKVKPLDAKYTCEIIKLTADDTTVNGNEATSTRNYDDLYESLRAGRMVWIDSLDLFNNDSYQHTGDSIRDMIISWGLHSTWGLICYIVHATSGSMIRISFTNGSYHT